MFTAINPCLLLNDKRVRICVYNFCSEKEKYRKSKMEEELRNLLMLCAIKIVVF